MHSSHKHLCNHGAESYLVLSNNYCNTPWIITAHLLNFSWLCLWNRRKFSGSFSNLLSTCHCLNFMQFPQATCHLELLLQCRLWIGNYDWLTHSLSFFPHTLSFFPHTLSLHKELHIYWSECLLLYQTIVKVGGPFVAGWHADRWRRC